MVSKNLMVIICITFLLLAGGCGNNEPNDVNDDEITIDLINSTETITVTVALFYGPDIDEWGEDLLGDEVIEPGEKVSFTLPEGTYTVIPMTAEYFVLPSARNISEDYSLIIGEEDSFPILVTNNTEVTIGSFYLSPTESTDWGQDWLGGEVIPVGVSRFFFAVPDTYDVLAIGMDNEVVLEDYEIEVDGSKHFIVE